MGDLEDNIFKINAPGRYSTWHKEERETDNRRALLDNDDVDQPELDENAIATTEEESLLSYARDLSNAEVPDSIRMSILAERSKGASTGVKGVLADYKAAQAMATAQEAANAAHRKDVLNRIAMGSKVKIADTVVIEPELEEEEIESDDELLNDDRVFMEEFRKKRLQELSSLSALPTFGAVREVTSADFVSEVDNIDPRVNVLVHRYEASVQSCVRLNGILEEIAATSMKEVKFLRMKASSNQIEIDLMTLPMLTFYRGGNVIGSAVAISRELDTEFFNKDDIEWLIDAKLNPQNKTSSMM